jgi:hypothetical protein
MAYAQEVVDLVATLRRIPEWSPGAVCKALEVKLTRELGTPAKVKRYHGAIDRGVLRTVRLTVPVFGGHLGWGVLVKVDWNGQVAQKDLGSLIPEGSKGSVMPAPTPGSKGPLRSSYSLRVPDAAGDAGFAFESLDRSPNYLVTVGLERPHPGNDDARQDARCFRSYAVHEGDARSYAIERRSNHEDAVVVSAVELKGRTAKVFFAVKELMILEPFARKLIRELLLGELLKDELAGKYDQVSYFATELETTTVEPALSR